MTASGHSGDERADTVPPAEPEHLSVPLLPAGAFLLVWSSGYIAGPWGVAAMSPLSLVAWRFVLATVVIAVLARLTHGPLRVGRRDALRIAVVGFVMNGLQFGSMYLAFDQGLDGTLGSLMHSLSPVVTALLAGLLLGERLRAAQLVGFVVGVAGVLLVLGPDVHEAGGPWGVAFAVVGMLALSVGTLGQRWIRRGTDPLWSATIQFAVSGPPVLVLALLLEGTDVVSDPAQAGLALAYLAVVNSIMGLVLLGLVVRRGGAGAGSAVFFLSPPVTALLAWFFFGDVLGLREWAGILVAIVGVAFAVRSGRRAAPGPPRQGGVGVRKGESGHSSGNDLRRDHG